MLCVYMGDIAQRFQNTSDGRKPEGIITYQGESGLMCVDGRSVRGLDMSEMRVKALSGPDIIKRKRTQVDSPVRFTTFPSSAARAAAFGSDFQLAIWMARVNELIEFPSNKEQP